MACSRALVTGAVVAVTILAPHRAIGSAANSTHPIRFFVDPALVPPNDEAIIAGHLAGYVEILNQLFKPAQRQFDFDPTTGVIVTPDAPESGWCCPGGAPLPESGFEIWARIRMTDHPEYGSYGGYMTLDESGAGVADGLMWSEVWDPGALEPGSASMEDFWRQIDHIAHELAHVFGAGISEYYNLAIVDDVTGREPRLDIDFSRYPDDPYWGTRGDFIGDPLLANAWDNALLGHPRDIPHLVAAARFAPLTCAVIARGLRNAGTRDAALPDLAHVRVVARDAATGQPLPDARVTVWSVQSAAPYACEVIAEGQANGFWFDWGNAAPFNNADHLRLVKASADGFRPGGAYVSVFDAQAAYLLDGLDTLTVEVALEGEASAAGPPATGRTVVIYPNPFNPGTTLAYAVEHAGPVRLTVYDVTGAVVRVIEDAQRSPGAYVARWDGTTASGAPAPSGVYFCRLDTPRSSTTCKMVLAR